MAKKPPDAPKVSEPLPPPIEGGTIDEVLSPSPRHPHALEDVGDESEETEDEGEDGVRAVRVGPFEQVYGTKPIPYRHRVAERIAYILLCLLGGTILVHYLMTAILIACFKDKYATIATEFDKIFNSLLPILSGLVGSAVTFYFTRETRGS